MAAPGSEISLAGNDGIEIDVVARGPQELMQAAARIATVAHDIDCPSAIDRPFMSFDERKLKEICREWPVGSALEMADMVRHVEGQIVRIDTPRLEAVSEYRDGQQTTEITRRFLQITRGNVTRPREQVIAVRN
jgi:hypothetical protein